MKNYVSLGKWKTNRKGVGGLTGDTIEKDEVVEAFEYYSGSIFVKGAKAELFVPSEFFEESEKVED